MILRFSALGLVRASAPWALRPRLDRRWVSDRPFESADSLRDRIGQSRREPDHRLSHWGSVRFRAASHMEQEIER